ncbi:MAG TPA: hypothetical protein VFI11_05235 [Anaerolineales bacterium]|nr:hypothetical protein [Anaerolineales bacterium]
MKTVRTTSSGTIRTGLLSLAIALGLSSCSPSGPQAWIDAPMHESVHPVEAMEIFLHAADPGGVAMIELSVNGEVLSRRPPDDTDSALTTFSAEWDPQEAGLYVLTARAQNQGGEWGAPTNNEVTLIGPQVADVVEPLEITPSLTPTATASATATATATPTSTSTPTAPLGGLSDVSISTHQVYFGLDTCDPLSVTFGVRATHPSGVRAVVFFHRLRNPQSGDVTDWSSGVAMPGGRSGYFSLAMSGDRLAGDMAWNESEVQYQFVLQPQSGAMTRSPVFSDLSLGRCGLIFFPPMVLSTPTLTPIVPH